MMAFITFHHVCLRGFDAVRSVRMWRACVRGVGESGGGGGGGDGGGGGGDFPGNGCNGSCVARAATVVCFWARKSVPSQRRLEVPRMRGARSVSGQYDSGSPE